MSKLTSSLILGCSIILAACANRGAQPEPTVIAAPSQILAFEQLRKDEIALAEQTRTGFASSFESPKDAALVKAEPLQFIELNMTAKKPPESKTVQVFDSLSISMPIALKKRPEYDQAMAKVKALAEKLADQRGGAEIQFFLLPADAKANKIKFDSGMAKSPQGNPITVSKSADKSLSKGIQRIVIMAKPIQNTAL